MNIQNPKRPTSGQRFARVAKFGAIFIVLFAAAGALHPPRYADGSPQSRDAALAECLRYLRTQIYLYALEHGGVAPGFPGDNVTLPPDEATFAAQMTGYTDASGRVLPRRTDDGQRGPYLLDVPSNPVTLRSGVKVVTTDGTARADESKPYGWIYNPLTRQISPNLSGADARGVSYASY